MLPALHARCASGYCRASEVLHDISLQSLAHSGWASKVLHGIQLQSLAHSGYQAWQAILTDHCALQASLHLKGGAKKVVISAPSAGMAYLLAYT